MTNERRTKRGIGLIVGLVLLLVAIACYAGAVVWADGKIPAETTIGGVDVGGLSEEAAEERLADRLADEAEAPITVEAGSKTVELDPQEAGLEYDYAASVAGLTGFSINPVDIIGRVTGGSDRPVETTVDEKALGAAVEKAAAEIDEKPVDAKIRIKDAKVRQTDAEPGTSVDQEALVSDIADEWPQATSFTAATEEVEPKLTDEEAKSFVEDELDPMLSGPVTVESTDPEAKGAKKDISFEVAPSRLAEALSVSTKGGDPAVRIDDKKLVRAVEIAAEKSESFRVAKDASVTWEGGEEYTVSPSSKGLALRTKGLADTVSAAMEKESAAQRTITVESKETDADFTTAEAKKTLPKEQISTFTTHLTDDEDRTENIAIAAERLNGTYVKPGETFSLNARLGERTAEKGYNHASVIMNGRLVKDYGGGISQLSTTLFNAVFFSGARIEEYQPHSWYIDRYPEGREATISWPNVDQKFTNDTGAGILIEAGVEGDDVTVSFHGRAPYDDVEAEKSERRNIVQPEVIVDDSEDCVPQSPMPGFDVTVERLFINDGKTVKKSDFNTHYVPEDEVTCTNSDH